MTAHRMPAKPRATELECETTILAAAARFGWLRHGERTVRVNAGARGYATPVKGDVGFPDLVLAHRTIPLAVVIELKRMPNRVEPEQQLWIDRLRAAGLDVSVWWVPEDLDAILAFLAAPGPIGAVLELTGTRWDATIYAGTSTPQAHRTGPNLAALVAWVERWANDHRCRIPIRIATPIGLPQ